MLHTFEGWFCSTKLLDFPFFAIVFERPKGRSWKKISQWWGHVAMYNGEQWISDFKQKRMNPYKTNVPYRIYRFNPNRSIDCYVLMKPSFSHLFRRFSVTMEPHCALKAAKHLF